MFLNFSNHPSSRWNQDQLAEAEKYGEIRDIPFPTVAASASEEEVAALAESYVDQIAALKPETVMCQGEYSLCIAVIVGLKKLGITCVCACSDRQVKETRQEDGTTRKDVVFAFRKFREYRF